MKKLILLFMLFCFGFSFSFAKKEFIDKTIDGKTVKVIKVVLDWTTKIVTSVAFTWWDSFENLVKKEWWDTWVNWAYFCPSDYPNCGWQTRTNADRIYQWTQYFKFNWDMWSRWMFGFDKNWKPMFVMNNEGYAWWYVRQYNNEKIDDVYYWISNHPVLLIEWEDVLSNSESLIDVKMRNSSSKSFICSSSDNKTVHMWNISNLTIYELPAYLKKNFDCYNAIALDNWWSLGMMYGWKTYTKPTRQIMDAFVVVDVKTDTQNNQPAQNNTTEKQQKVALINSIKLKFKQIKTKANKDKIKIILADLKEIMKEKQNYLDKLKKIDSFLDIFVGEG